MSASRNFSSSQHCFNVRVNVSLGNSRERQKRDFFSSSPHLPPPAETNGIQWILQLNRCEKEEKFARTSFREASQEISLIVVNWKAQLCLKFHNPAAWVVSFIASMWISTNSDSLSTSTEEFIAFRWRILFRGRSEERSRKVSCALLYSLQSFDDFAVSLIASPRIPTVVSTNSLVAFAPINPIRKICPAVGPRPPLISNLYLAIAYLETSEASTPAGTFTDVTEGVRCSRCAMNISNPSDSRAFHKRLEAVACRDHDASRPPCSNSIAIASRNPYSSVEQTVWW